MALHIGISTSTTKKPTDNPMITGLERARFMKRSIKAAAARGEQSRRAPLQKQNDGRKHGDLAEDRSQMRLQHLVGHADAQGGGDRAHQIADASEHDDHEAIHNVALAETGADIANLRQT